MAVATEAERRHREAGGTRSADLHKAMVEEALHGYDVQLSAVHFAATSLAMLNPAIQFDRMNLSVMSLGAEGTEISLGSLDFLESDSVAVQFALSPTDMGIATLDRARISGRGPRGAAQGESVTLPDLDLAIMNPPFTRSVGGNLLFGSLPQSRTKRRLQDELCAPTQDRTAGVGYRWTRRGLRSCGLAEAASRAKVAWPSCCPATVCTGPAWQQTRDLIQRDFALDTCHCHLARPRALELLRQHRPLRSSPHRHAAPDPRKERPVNPAPPSSTSGATPTACSPAHRIAQRHRRNNTRATRRHGYRSDSSRRPARRRSRLPPRNQAGRQTVGRRPVRPRRPAAQRSQTAGRRQSLGTRRGKTPPTIPLCRLGQLGQIGPDRTGRVGMASNHD